MLDAPFKPAWKSGSVEKRLKAVAELDGARSEDQEILTQLAESDEDISIRIAAIHKLSSAITLYEMSKNASNDSICTEAEKRFNEILQEKHFLSVDQYRDLLNRYPELILRIAAHAAISSVRAEVIQSLSATQLLDVLDLTTYTNSRKLIAEKLTDIEDIKSAVKIIRGKDKSAEGVLNTKIDEFKKQELQHAENLETVEKLIEEAEYLAVHDWQPGFKYQILVNQRQWDNLDFEINPDSIRRYQAARKIIDSRLEEQNKIEQTQKSQEQLLIKIETYLRTMSGKNLNSSIDTLSDTQAKYEQFSEEWRQLFAENRPHLVIHDRYEKLINAIQSAIQLVRQASELLQSNISTELDEADVSRRIEVTRELADNSKKLKATLKKLKWPSSYGNLKVVAELEARLKDWNRIQKKYAVERKEHLDLLHKKISSIFRLSRSGNLTRAKQLCERVEKKLGQYEGKDRLILEERFEEARKTLDNMGDWNNFATEPKYIELCEAMEHFATSNLHPEKLSSEVKHLQQRWKSLGRSDISDQYWPRFKQASDIAYKPCAEFFEERQKTRKTHLEQREQYVEAMQKLFDETDWDNDPDYKAVQASVRSISDKFSNIKDVERNAGQKQWKKFSKIRDKINAKLDAVYAENIALKRELIEQAEALADATPAEDNLDKLKTLQTQWKQIGITKRNEGQKAWTKFKKQTDMVYNKVQVLRQKQKEDIDQELSAYRDVIKDIQKLAATAKDLAQADHQFTALQAKYTDLPELPRQLPEKLKEGIQRDYRNACKKFSESRSRIINNAHKHKINTLRQKADLCAQLEALGKSPPTEKLQEITQRWNAIDLNDAALSQRIEARRDAAQADIDRIAIGAERRMICIQLEIAMGVESPEDDKALRMQYQLEQMNKSGLGSQTVISAEQLEKMEVDWLCMAGAERNLQKELDKRFQQALQSKHKGDRQKTSTEKSKARSRRPPKNN